MFLTSEMLFQVPLSVERVVNTNCEIKANVDHSLLLVIGNSECCAMIRIHDRQLMLPVMSIVLKCGMIGVLDG